MTSKQALVEALVADLTAESAELDTMVSLLTDEQWHTPTPAEGWDVADTIAHLASTDEVATMSATDGTAFQAWLEREVVPDLGASYVEKQIEPARALTPVELLTWWREGREEFVSAIVHVDSGVKLPWFGPPMSPASFVTARLMETWAHGLDVADALGLPRPAASARLRHVAEISVRTRGWSYMTRGLPIPDSPLRVELTAPDGEVWVWGPEDAPSTVRGSALEFCLVAVQRLHRDDTSLVGEGPHGEEFLGLAQAYAGPAGKGRAPQSG